MQKKKDWQIHNLNGELVKSTLVVIIGSKIFCHNGSWYLEEGNTTDLEDYRQGYQYPKGTSNHYQHV